MKILVAALLGFVVGFFAALSIQNLLQAGEASKNKRSIAEARNIADALEKFHGATGKYPPLDRGVAALTPYLEPKFTRHVSITDAYARPYIVFLDDSGPAIVSTGRNGFVVRKTGVLLPADNSLHE
jgi:hypothetical protein